jgi:protein TonB
MHTGRKISVAASVLLLHAGALWAFQSGLVRRVVAAVDHGEVVVELIAPEPEPPKLPPVAQVTPPPRAVPKPQHVPTPAPAPVARRSTPPAAPAVPAPLPVAIADPTPAPDAPTGAAPAPLPPAATPKPALVTLPSSDADYLQNPKPDYPALSRRKREQGKVVVRVFIGVDGTAQKVELGASSGFARLDQTALDTVQRWRYVPGKQGGVPVAMWFNVPIQFSLE